MLTPPSHHDISGVILAGGLSRRMNRQNKGLIHWRGRPLIAHVIERFAPQVGSLLINANHNQEDYAAFTYPLLGDTLPGFVGPLAGVLAALQTISGDWLVSVPCDAPLLPDDLVARLLATWQRLPHTTIVFAETEQRTHPTFALLHRSIAADLNAYLVSGERRLEVYYRSRGAAIARFPNESAFRNFNTPDDLSQ